MVLLTVAAVPSCGEHSAPPTSATAKAAKLTPTTTTAPAAPVVPAGDFTLVAQLVADAIAAPRMPGAVVQIGHGGDIVFRQVAVIGPRGPCQPYSSS